MSFLNKWTRKELKQLMHSQDGGAGMDGEAYAEAHVASDVLEELAERLTERAINAMSRAVSGLLRNPACGCQCHTSSSP